ncbi:MAG: galactokinase [Terriglobales bacterium]
MAVATLEAAFRLRFGGEPELWRAPGRINLIGEHTDYNQGWVMPAAVPMSASVAAASRDDRRVVLYSEHFAGAANFSLNASSRALPAWSLSLRGVALLLDRHRRLPGANLLLRSEVPVGAGLSSSAAVEVAVALALAAIAGVRMDEIELARLCQQASHQFAHTRCGLMDPYIACRGRAGRLLKLDTRSLEETWFVWPPEWSLLAFDSGVRHTLAAGNYNRRPEECEVAAGMLGCSLRDLELQELEKARDRLGAVLHARCRHVLTENARVGQAARALTRHDAEALGALLNESHASLRDDFQVSCPELDTLADICRGQPGVFGARMMGGGFGGSVLVLAHHDAAPALEAAVVKAYEAASGRTTTAWACPPSGSAGPIAYGGEHA